MSPRLVLPGPHPGARPGVGARKQASAPWVKTRSHGLHPWGPAGQSPNEQRGLPSGRLTTAGGFRRGRCYVIWVAVVGGAPVTQSPDGDSGHGDMECHLAGGESA